MATPRHARDESQHTTHLSAATAPAQTRPTAAAGRAATTCRFATGQRQSTAPLRCRCRGGRDTIGTQRHKWSGTQENVSLTPHLRPPHHCIAMRMKPLRLLRNAVSRPGCMYRHSWGLGGCVTACVDAASSVQLHQPPSDSTRCMSHWHRTCTPPGTSTTHLLRPSRRRISCRVMGRMPHHQ